MPQKLKRSNKRPRSHLPPVDVGPLVNQQREVAVGLDPLREHVVHDRLRRRAHDEGFLELLAAAARHERELGENPSTCDASLVMNEYGMSWGKYAFWTPDFLKSASIQRWMPSQMA